MENANENQQPQQQAIPPLPNKKWYRHKGILTIVILALVAGTAVWIYFILNQPQIYEPIVITHHHPKTTQPIATSSTSQVDASNWQTYSDANEGFQIKYPTGWSYSTDNSDPNSPVIRFYPPGQTIGNGYGGDFILDTLSNPQKLDLKTFYQGQNINNFAESATQTPLTINGYPAEEFIGTDDEIASDIISVDLGQTVVELTDVAQQHANDGMMNAMANSINTFQTSNQSEASSTTENLTSWQTYTSNDLGINIQYPDSWFVSTSTVLEFSNVQGQPALTDETLKSTSQFTVQIITTTNSLSIADWYQQNQNNFANTPTSEIAVTVSGYPAVKFKIPEIGEWTYYYVAVGSDIYAFGYLDADSQSQPSQFSGLYQTMVNSIKFLSKS